MPQPLVSILTPTCRPEGLEIVQKAIKRQTYDDIQWIVSSPRHIKIKGFNRIDTLLSDPPKQPGDYWSVYKSYNKMVRHSEGELIISWQDHTFTNPDTIERFAFHYQNNPKALVTAVGNKYLDDTWGAITWKDPRITDKYGSFYQCNHNDIEFNLCAIPREAIYSVGGFDETLDRYSSLCGLDVLDRLNIQGGWEFYIDQSIHSYSTEHGRLPKWDEYLPFNGPYQERLKQYRQTPILEYLP